MLLVQKRIIINLFIVMLSFGLMPIEVSAKINVGMGMEYNTVKVKVIDQENRFFHTLLQSTVGITSIKYEEKLFMLGMDGGWSDWNVSGDWEGTNLSFADTDNLGWLAQQYYSIYGSISPLQDWSLGCSYTEQRIRHYESEFNSSFLSYRTKNIDTFISYNWLHLQDLKLFVKVNYTLLGTIAITQDTMIPLEEFAVHSYNEIGKMEGWQGTLGMVYEDDRKWCLSLEYNAGLSRGQEFEEIKELTIVNGRLSGLFIIFF